MSSTTANNKSKFWRTDWFVGALIVFAVLVLHQISDLTGGLERRFYDFASTSNGRQPSDRIAVIAIDDQSIANIGRWPWPRDVQAQMIDLLAAAKVKVIANTVFYFEPQSDRGLGFVRRIKESLAVSAGDTPTAANEAIFKIIDEAEQKLDTDAILANSIARAGNVLIGSNFKLEEPLGRADIEMPAFALKSTVDDQGGFSWPASKAQFPMDAIGHAAAGMGHMNQINDVDGALRVEPMLVNYFGKDVPSMALIAAMKSLNLDTKDIRLNPGDSVQLGKLRIRTDERALMRPQFYSAKEGKSAFAVDSFFDVLNGKIPASKYADKIVVIGATAAGVGVQFPVPGHSALTPVETIAHIISSILSEHFIAEPSWGAYVSLVAYLVVAAYLIAGLPRLSAGTAAIATATLLAILLGTEFGLLAGSSIWIKLVLPAALLVFGHLGLTTKRFLMAEAGKLKSDEESAETNRMMGLAYQGQGQLDMAFDRFRRAPLSDALMENLNNLALDFERKRQFNKAQAVYEHMAQWNQNYKDLKTKITRVKNLSETVMLGGSSTGNASLLLDGGAVEKPMLGRYQVEKELGKGAMGVVYLGKDPKIGRVVAIKTMALGQEFEGDALDDARERFFREAETAGRLQHQNIVTIFDAGEEHDLAYIAMEFLKGRDLVNCCKDGSLLPVPQVLSIVARVADALAYAHKQNVVHRDIKPANIMYEPETDTVKVTDFGIARITDSSKTKTGLVLGTPSFMSPEQIAGKRVDGRSDLYSLGVMLFQMLTGVLPFRGDSMAELMYKIANEAEPDIRFIRPELPGRLTGILATALHKQVESRYQTGDQLASDLRSLGVESMLQPGQAQVALPPDLKSESAVNFASTTAIPVQDTPSEGERTVVMPRQDTTPDEAPRN